MKKSAKHKIRLQARDKRVFKYLLKCKLATEHQIIREGVFATPRNHVWRRLNQLNKASYLAASWTERKKVHSLGKEGERFLFREGLIPKIYKIGHLGAVASKIEHDVLLNDVYWTIEKLPNVKNLKTHNHFMLEDRADWCTRNVPDALITLNDHGEEKAMAVELELTQKVKSDYIKVLSCYYDDSDVSAVLYLVRNSSLERRIIEVDRGFESLSDYQTSGGKVFVGNIDEFLLDPSSCLFRSSSGHKLQLQHFIGD